MMTNPDLDVEMAAMWERIQARKAQNSALPPQSFEVRTVVSTFAQTSTPPPADTVNVDNYAGDPVSNPDAQGL